MVELSYPRHTGSLPQAAPRAEVAYAMSGWGCTPPGWWRAHRNKGHATSSADVIARSST